MSSNTLRGGGHKGGGEGKVGGGDGGGDSDGRGGNKGETEGQAERASRAPDTVGAQIGEQLKLAEKFRDRFRGNSGDQPPQARSQEATSRPASTPQPIPPEDTPQGSTKMPSFSATLIGVPAPILNLDPAAGARREAWHTAAPSTVEVARDVVASPVVDHQDAAPVEAAPEAIDHSEPTRGDSTLAAAVARAMMSVEVPRATPAEMASPWYDQAHIDTDPIYDEPRPNLVTRVAIGAAVAALLAIAIFGFARLRMRNGAGAADEAPAGETAVGRDEPARPFSLIAPTTPPPSEPPVPTTEGSTATAVSPDRAGAPPVIAPMEGLREPEPERPPSSADLEAGLKPRPAARRTPAAPTAASNRAVGTSIVNRSPGAPTTPSADALGRRGFAPTSPGPGQVGTDVGQDAPSAIGGGVGARAPAAAPDLPAASTRPPAATTPPAPSTNPSADKAKAKPTYDPDSTLPLNVE